MPDLQPELISIARCPEHGIHGERTECFVCAGPVEQLPMAQVPDGSRVGTYAFDAPLGWAHELIEVVQTGRIEGPVFVPTADVWAIRKREWCWAKSGEWECEPQPSSRDEEFLARCRYTLTEALLLAAVIRAAEDAQREARRPGCCWACEQPLGGHPIRTRGTTVCSLGCQQATEEAIAPGRDDA